MQRHLKTPEPQPAPIPTLSAEELAIQEDEQSEASMTADAAAIDADRVTEVAEIAQDAVLVVDMTPEVGQVDADLVGAVGDMAVAGTDGNAADIINIPPTEGSDAMAVEGIASALKSIWDAIVTAIRNMWVGIKQWLTMYFSSLEQNKKHAEKLVERLTAMKGWLANGGSTLTSTITDIYDFGGKSSFMSFLHDIEGEDKYARSYVLEAMKEQPFVVGIGDLLEKAYSGYNGSAGDFPAPAVDQISHRIAELVKKLDLTRAKGDTWQTTKAMGNIKVIAQHYNDQMNQPGQSVETKIALLTKVRFTVDVNTHFTSQKNISMKQDVTADKLLEDVKDRLAFINELIKFKTTEFKALETQVEKVEKACSEMLNRIKEDNRDGIALARRIMPLSTAYSNWATQPLAKLLQAMARHNKFWLSLFEMAANNMQKPATA